MSTAAHFSGAEPRSMRELAGRFRSFFLYAAFFSMVINLLMLVPAIFMLQVFDRVVTSRSVETLAMLAAFTVGALVFMSVLDVVRSRLLTAAAVSMERDLGPTVMADLVRRASSATSSDTTHGMRDVAALRNFLSGPGLIALFDAPWLPIYVLIIWLFHPLLGMIAAGGAVLLIVLAWVNEKLTRAALEEAQIVSRGAGRFADQSVRNAEASAGLGIIDNLSRGWESINSQALALQLRASRKSTVVTALTRLLRQLLQVAMLAAGAWLVIHQQSTSGVMIAATILLGRALAPVEAVASGWKMLVEARAAWGRLDWGLSAARPTESVTELPAPQGALSVDRIVFGFQGRNQPVLKQVSFEVAPGEVLALVGPSAAGKSTLARVIVGLWRPHSGTVRLDGADITSWPRSKLGPHIGFLPQDVELFSGTVAQNIARMGEVDSAAVIQAAQRANVHDMILRLPGGYDTPIEETATLLSAGQRQRVALARALYGNPKLVVLDEPNSNLDFDGERSLVDAVRGLKERGATVIVITHRAALLAAADKVAVLRDGAIEKVGSMSDIMPKAVAKPADAA